VTRPLRAAAWLAGLLAAGLLLRALGEGALAAPPLGSPGALVSWVEAREPITALVALVRLVAELAVWYVLGVSALHVAAGVLRRRGAHRLADALALPAVARLVKGGLGLGLVAATTVQPSGAATPPGHGTATMTPAPTRSPSATATMAPTTGTATMQPVPAPAPAPAPPPPTAAVVATTWTVAPGESFWSIAEEVLADAWGRPATDAEVDPYWRTLVERNRARLADPDDPDLLHPGQVLDLPPLP